MTWSINMRIDWVTWRLMVHACCHSMGECVMGCSKRHVDQPCIDTNRPQATKVYQWWSVFSRSSRWFWWQIEIVYPNIPWTCKIYPNIPLSIVNFCLPMKNPSAKALPMLSLEVAASADSSTLYESWHWGVPPIVMIWIRYGSDMDTIGSYCHILEVPPWIIYIYVYICIWIICILLEYPCLNGLGGCSSRVQWRQYDITNKWRTGWVV